MKVKRSISIAICTLFVLGGITASATFLAPQTQPHSAVAGQTGDHTDSNSGDLTDPPPEPPEDDTPEPEDDTSEPPEDGPSDGRTDVTWGG